jgi:hypothetical protein
MARHPRLSYLFDWVTFLLLYDRDSLAAEYAMIRVVTRETRLNLWFLAIFLTISLPGAVILFIKKLDPLASRMDQPDAVLTQLPYMSPDPEPSGVRRMVPPKTRQWLVDLTRQKTGDSLASSVGPGPEWEPVISGDHVLQVLSASSASDSSAMSLLLWNGPSKSDVNAFDPVLRVDGQAMPTRITDVETIEVPEAVRHELVSLGYTHPPKKLTWMRAEAKGVMRLGENADLELRLTGDQPLRTAVSWVIR